MLTSVAKFIIKYNIFFYMKYKGYHKQGKITELKASILLMEQGFECFKPLVDMNGSDLTVRKDGKYYTVQVKGCYNLHKSNRAVFSLSKWEKQQNFDYLLCMYKDTFWFIPKSKVNSKVIFCALKAKNIAVNKYAKYQNRLKL